MYKSYALGFDAAANELVILRVKADLYGYGEMYRLRGDGIGSAGQKKSSFAIKIFIQDESLPERYIELIVPRQVTENTDGEIMQVEQSKEADRFLDFFTNQFSK